MTDAQDRHTLAASMLIDGYDLPVSTASADAVEHLDEGMGHVFAADGHAAQAFLRATQADPEFALAYFLLARERLMAGDRAAAMAAFAKAYELAPRASARERQHMFVTMLLSVGDPRALDLAKAHLADHPRDILMLLQVVTFLFWRGGVGKRPATVEYVTSFDKHYAVNDWKFGMLMAVALGENGEHDAAYPFITSAMEAHANNPFALHGLMHLYAETNQFKAAVELLDSSLPNRGGWLRGHLWWHRVLFGLELGQVDGPLGLFAEHVRPKGPGPFLQLADAAQILWRCRIYGVEHDALSAQETRDQAIAILAMMGSSTVPTKAQSTAERLRALLPSLAGEAPSFELAMRCFGEANRLDPPAPFEFIEVHAAMAFALAEDATAKSSQLERLTRRLDGPNPAHARVVLSLVRGIYDYARGRFLSSIQQLEAVNDHELDIMGGSNVEREALSETLLCAYLKAGRDDQAKRWLERRMSPTRPTGRHLLWLSRALRGVGKEDRSRLVEARARELWNGAEPVAFCVLA